MAVAAQLALAFGLVPAFVLALRAVERRLVEGRPVERRLCGWLPRHRWRRRPRPGTAPAAGRRPLQVVAADLRRLSRQLTVVPAGAPLLRWQALWAAFDGVLGEAAEQLDVPHELATTPTGMGRDLERLRVLAALESAGLMVHD